MPSGYTISITDGKSFEDFVVSCARAFGAFVHQRDDNGKNKFARVSNHYLNEILVAEQKLSKLTALSNYDRQLYARKIKQNELDRLKEWLKQQKDMLAKYENMLLNVLLWEPPTRDHEALKEFMIQEIEDSIKWDCDTIYTEKDIKRLERKSLKDIFSKELKQVKDSLEYYKESYDKEKDRVEKANKWIIELYNSLNKDVEELL